MQERVNTVHAWGEAQQKSSTLILKAFRSFYI